MALFNDQTGTTGGETFIQRQQRLQGEQTAQTASPTTQQTSYSTQSTSQPVSGQTSVQAAPAPTGTTMGTPVQGDGKIPPPQPMTSLQAQAPATAPQQPQNNQTWQSPYAPLMSMNLGNEQIPTYQAGQFQTQVTQPGQLPQSYQGTQMSQFQAPNQQGLNDAQSQLLQRLLQNPETLGPQQLAALKEKQKEAAMLQEQQGLQTAMQNAASRGTTNGGALAGIQRALGNEKATNIINSNRELDLAAAQQNRADIAQALGLTESILGGQMGRATQGFGATLAGQQAQAQDSRTVSQDAISAALAQADAQRQAQALNLQKEGMQADENFRGYQSQANAQQAAVERILQQFGINQATRQAGLADQQFGLQTELGMGGLKLDRDRLNTQNQQFLMDFLENQRMNNNNLGYNYAALNQSGQGALVSQILGMLG